MYFYILNYLIFGFFISNSISQNTNNIYCTKQKQLCPWGGKHVGCTNAKAAWAPKCRNPQLVLMSKDVQAVILDAHNSLRNHTAAGKLRGYPAAKHMRVVTWNTELARLAALNVRKCDMQHDECHNTEKFPYSGQNLAMEWSMEPIAPNVIKSRIKFLIQMWFDEYKLTTSKIIDKCCGNSYNYLHFLAMVNDRTKEIGCAISVFRDENLFKLLLACNYANTNLVGDNIYTKGIAASGCKTGKHPKYKALCSSKEKTKNFGANNFT